MARHAGIRMAMLNDWQRGFPLVEEPFARIGAKLGIDTGDVLEFYRELLASGAISRVGGVWAAGAGGAAMLCAFAVPPERLSDVAGRVSDHPAVNHNYEREHEYNLWFVVTRRDQAAVFAVVDELEATTGCRALRLPMLRSYRIDLGFDLRRHLAAGGQPGRTQVRPVEPSEMPLAGLLEEGLPLVERPFAQWAERLGEPEEQVLETLQRWLVGGALRRFGVIVRHHEAGFIHNAMTVFDVPDAQVDSIGSVLARQTGVTLAYRRARADGWPFNLYCMVHGRDRSTVVDAVEAATTASGLSAFPRRVLFSRRRFKQEGGRYFSATPAVERRHAEI